MAPHPCLLMLLLCLVPAARAAATCTITDCVLDCAGCTTGDMVPDPADCSRFYVCNGDGSLMIPDPMECDEGKFFDYTTQECNANATCKPCTIVSSCTYDCTKPNGNGEVSSSHNCSIYYTCNGRVRVTTNTCPPSAPYYDGNTCQTNQSHCCQCILNCNTEDVHRFIPDPTDCRTYHYCSVEGPPIGSTTCPKGENFDSTLQSCSSSAPCDPPCKNLAGSDGCIDPYICEATGYFAKCPGQCTPEYYHCTTVSGEYIEASSCPSGYVFHPDSHMCVEEDQCP